MGAKWKHFKTICKHKAYVYHECKACGIWWQGVIHDLSKFGPTEFVSSANHFQGNRSPIEAEKEDVGYSIAWLHHKGINKHHWEWWTDFDDKGNIIPNKIPKKYVIEMICDWIGAGKAYDKGEWTQSSPLKFFESHIEGRHFHKETLSMILYLLRILKGYGPDVFHSIAKKWLNNKEAQY